MSTFYRAKCGLGVYYTEYWASVHSSDSIMFLLWGIVIVLLCYLGL
ncbi:hypothetical protein XBFM1_620001 [Xenorhabdus bovienii str. feltiae Moldova]|uniref:Uncharacterized protein n=1 Tax=Xenorhabdus bovienii str. feltiae Moldova TaxID=1398200 RepID=A0A077NMB5_XENBV|nr:hypothetical protein XBFM1_620001 [Xenorhabdus bovienii str. feltiae Moldova]